MALLQAPALCVMYVSVSSSVSLTALRRRARDELLARIVIWWEKQSFAYPGGCGGI